jgi:uncharacterized membrane protein (DUF2068 family)
MAQRGRSRPLGVTLIAILLGISMVTNFLVVVILLTQTWGGIGSGNLLAAILVTLAFSGVLLLAELVLVWGVWTLKWWAFWATVIVVSLHLLNGIVGFFSHSMTWWSSTLSIVIPLVILVYLLTDRAVRRAFRVSW